MKKQVKKTSKGAIKLIGAKYTDVASFLKFGLKLKFNAEDLNAWPEMGNNGARGLNVLFNADGEEGQVYIMLSLFSSNKYFEGVETDEDEDDEVEDMDEGFEDEDEDEDETPKRKVRRVASGKSGKGKAKATKSKKRTARVVDDWEDMD